MKAFLNKCFVFFFYLAIHDSSLDASELTTLNALNAASTMLEVRTGSKNCNEKGFLLKTYSSGLDVLLF